MRVHFGAKLQVDPQIKSNPNFALLNESLEQWQASQEMKDTFINTDDRVQVHIAPHSLQPETTVEFKVFIENMEAIAHKANQQFSAISDNETINKIWMEKATHHLNNLLTLTRNHDAALKSFTGWTKRTT